MPRLSDSDNDDYTSTARFLNNPTEDSLPARDTRPRPLSAAAGDRMSFAPPRWSRIADSASDLRTRILSRSPLLTTVHDRALSLWSSLTPPQRILVLGALLVAFLFGLLSLVYHGAILRALQPTIATWRSSPTAWLIPFVLILVVSFPPLIGYSTLFTLSGFIFGLWRGYLIVAPATVLGSSLSFLLCRTYLKAYTRRLADSDKRFQALSLTLKHDGLKLLIMIRLCPLPYSLSNAAISSVPGVSVASFAAATALSTPKLLVGIFIGSRLGLLAGEEGEKMDLGAKVASYISIAVGMGVAVGTGWWMYTRVQRRAKELEELERRAGRQAEEGGGGGDEAAEYADWGDDDVEDEEARQTRPADGISLHTTAEDPEDGPSAYGDAFADDDDDDGDGAEAASLDAVFSAGDGDDSGDEERRGGYSDRDSSAKNNGS